MTFIYYEVWNGEEGAEFIAIVETYNVPYAIGV